MYTNTPVWCVVHTSPVYWPPGWTVTSLWHAVSYGTHLTAVCHLDKWPPSWHGTLSAADWHFQLLIDTFNYWLILWTVDWHFHLLTGHLDKWQPSWHAVVWYTFTCWLTLSPVDTFTCWRTLSPVDWQSPVDWHFHLLTDTFTCWLTTLTSDHPSSLKPFVTPPVRELGWGWAGGLCWNLCLSVWPSWWTGCCLAV